MSSLCSPVAGEMQERDLFGLRPCRAAFSAVKEVSFRPIIYGFSFDLSAFIS